MTTSFAQVRPLLRARKIDGMCGTGASEDLIRDCEKTLNIRFPDSYRCFLNDFGWGYFGSLELIAGLGTDIPPEWERGANVLNVVTDERRGRMRFPMDVIPICQNGAGDWYALDCRSRLDDECPVVFISHEQAASAGFQPIARAESFAEWIFLNLADPNQAD